MPGFETFKPNGGAQFMADRGTLPLYQKQSKTVNTSGSYNSNTAYLPYELNPSKTPIMAVRPPSNSQGMNKAWEWLWDDLEASNAGNRGGSMYNFPASLNTNGSAYDVYIFSNNRNLNPSNIGFQYFDGGGGLVYDLNDKPFRVVDSFQTGYQPTNTGWYEDRVYDSSRAYAVVVTSYSGAEWVYYNGTRTYNPSERNWEYQYNSTTYAQYFRPISGGFRFFNLQLGTENNSEQAWGASSSSSPPMADSWRLRSNSQRFMIVDVTGY